MSKKREIFDDLYEIEKIPIIGIFASILKVILCLLILSILIILTLSIFGMLAICLINTLYDDFGQSILRVIYDLFGGILNILTFSIYYGYRYSNNHNRTNNGNDEELKNLEIENLRIDNLSKLNTDNIENINNRLIILKRSDIANTSEIIDIQTRLKRLELEIAQSDVSIKIMSPSAPPYYTPDIISAEK